MTAGDFLNQVLAAIQGMGGLAGAAKISAIIMLIIASMKVSFVNKYFWSKLGEFRVYIAPLLGLVAGVLSLGATLTLPAVFAYMGTGAGAVFLHEILDSVKAIPGLGQIYVTVINLFEGILGGGIPK